MGLLSKLLGKTDTPNTKSTAADRELYSICVAPRPTAPTTNTTWDPAYDRWDSMIRTALDEAERNQ